ncbi:MAG TPA: hypothetical protein VMZ22_12870 [Acidimicrobiales bacterium]|nr:hypothetical protein [Acidimicrobiales bacterium]
MRSLEVPETVAALLAELSCLEGLTLKGKTQTAIYRKGKPFLHFHWDAEGIVADVRYSGDWERAPASTAVERRQLVADVRTFLAATS